MELKFLSNKKFIKFSKQKAYQEIASKVREIAIYKGGGGLGDLVVSMPLFKAFKQAFPEARINYMGTVYPRFEGVFKSIECIDGYIPYERPHKGKGLSRQMAYRKSLKGKIEF